MTEADGKAQNGNHSWSPFCVLPSLLTRSDPIETEQSAFVYTKSISAGFNASGGADPFHTISVFTIILPGPSVVIW